MTRDNFFTNLWENQKTRVIYTIISVILLIVLYYASSTIISNSSSYNIFSYYGTVATLIGLIITICEIFHSVRISKSIKKQSEEIVSEYKNINITSVVSECLSCIDSISNNISNEKYDLALNGFNYFRRSFFRIYRCEELAEIKISINFVEIKLQAATATTAAAPLPMATRKNILKKLLEIKNHVENIDPATGVSYVPR